MTDVSDAFDDQEGEELDESKVDQAMRWRLILGSFADDRLGYDRLQSTMTGLCCDGEGAEGGLGEGNIGSSDLASLLKESRTMDEQLQYIYDREFAARSHRAVGRGGSGGLTVPMWLKNVRELFPQEAVEVMEKDALLRYGLTEMVTDPEFLKKAEPSEGLMQAVLQFKHLMKGEVLDEARRIVKAVVDQLAEKLMSECFSALNGPVNPDIPPKRVFHNTDWRKTIIRNLKNWDPDRQRLIAERIFFKHNQRQKSPWRVVVSVDQSGSMLDNLVHSAIMAAIFTALPSVKVNLVLWDTRIVDMSDIASDPLEVLMSCQLGGGNDDTAAMRYCASLITEPTRTVFVTISDWYICVPEKPLLALAHELHEAGVTCIGLSALDTTCKPMFNEDHARKLAGCGWYVAAMTPKQLAEHVGKILGG